MKFEWDETKKATHFEKHGIGFEEAQDLFCGTYKDKTLHKVDTRKDYGEIRINSVGMTNNGLIITVAMTWRNGSIRIINARRSSKSERRFYNGD